MRPKIKILGAVRFQVKRLRNREPYAINLLWGAGAEAEGIQMTLRQARTIARCINAVKGAK